METTETYLNLNSEQFSSWLNEFDNKYKKAEKTLLTSEEKLSEKENESESEEIENNSESDESEVENKAEESDVFIKKDITETPDFNTENSSSVNRFLRRKVMMRPTPVSSEKKETSVKKEQPQKPIEKKEFIYQIPKEKILSLAEINKILPKKELVKEAKQSIDETNKAKDENTKKLSGVALYKLISRRR